MTKFNALELIQTVTNLRVKVLRSRHACKTDFARGLHVKLLEKLDEMNVDLREEMATERRLAADSGTREGEVWYALYHICRHFEHKWTEEGPISLLDEIHVNVVAEGEGEVCRVGRDYSVVPDDRLEGLAELADTLRKETGVSFIVALVAGKGEAS